MGVFYLIGIMVIFCVLQFVLSAKIKNVLIQHLLIGATTIGLLFCFVLYSGVFWIDSPSIIAENQYFARFISGPLGAGFIGCLLGLLMYKLLKNNN